MDAVLTQHIVMTPDVCFGKPRIAGRRVAVMTIVIHILHMGGTPESAAHSYAVSLAEVYAALAFYYDNQHLINASIDEINVLDRISGAITPTFTWKGPLKSLLDECVDRDLGMVFVDV